MEKGKIFKFPAQENIHTKKHEMALRSILTSFGESYYVDESTTGIIILNFESDNGISAEQKIYIKNNDYICYSMISCKADPENKEMIDTCIRIANRINYKLDHGHFVVNEVTGEIFFISYYGTEERINEQLLCDVFTYPRMIINRYGKRFDLGIKRVLEKQ